MTYKVFISSTGKDLADYREAAIAECNRLGLVPIGMEFFEAMGVGATQGSLAKLDEADVYVGIFAHRYGYIEDDYDRSVTELEFDHAGERGLERLCFALDPKHPWPPDAIDFAHYAELAAFKVRMDKLIRNLFTDLPDFRLKLHHALSEWLKKQAPTPAAADKPGAAVPDPYALGLLSSYYRSIRQECAKLPLASVDPKFADPDSQLELPAVYTALDVTTPPRETADDAKAAGERAWRLRLARAEEGERTPVLEGVAQGRAAHVVLLGDPGSGKTTFVHYLAGRLAEGIAEGAPLDDLPEPLRGRFPVRFVLREVGARIPAGTQRGHAGLLWEALKADLGTRLGSDDAARVFPVLRGRLTEKGFFMLDGLDEVPETGERRRVVLEAIAELAASLPKTVPVLVTGRPYAYADPKRRLAGFEVLLLAPLNAEQVATFVAHWYRAVTPVMGWAEQTAEARAGELTDVLQGRAYLADLASRPLLLTLIASLHTSRARLPEDRADLYEESVELLLHRWQRRLDDKDAEGHSLLDPGVAQALSLNDPTLRRGLERLAYETHARQGQASERDDAPADIDRAQVLDVFAPLLPRDYNALGLIEFLDQRAGLLAGRGDEVFAFVHRSFQEYLAACHLANTGDLGTSLRERVYADPIWWREVFLLGVGKASQGGVGAALNVVNTLLPEAPAALGTIADADWRAAVLAGQALVDLRLDERAAEHPAGQALQRRVRAWLVRLLADAPLPARERAEGGDVLAALGDPRFDPERWYLPKAPLFGFVFVPPDRFRMGSDPQQDAGAYEEEQPPHEVTLPGYWMARWPVTVAQFRAFVESSRLGAHDEDALAGSDNHPVTFVSWHDAQAYCHWLDEQLKALAPARLTGEPADETERVFWEGLAKGKLGVGLPSEAEWERAARGTDGRIYPWDGEADPERANYADTGIKGTTAVGCFPGGITPSGCEDMSGNVWEWTRSLWGEDWQKPEFGYPYDPDDRRREDLAAPDSVLRVLRGGAFTAPQEGVRCAYRVRDGPDSRSHGIGFRVVVSPFFSER